MNDYNSTGGMTCEQALKQIERMIEECDLKEVERTLLSVHLRSCSSCKAEFERCRRLELRIKSALSAVDTAPDFTQRVLALLPLTARSLNSPSRKLADMPAVLRRKDSDLSRSKSRTMVGRWIVLPAGIAALIAIALISNWNRTGLGQDAALLAPTCEPLSGDARIVDKSGQRAQLSAPRGLRPDETIIAGGSERLVINLTFRNSLLASVVLTPGSELRALNRHAYILEKGAAYFDVDKNRPRNKDEYFEVAAGELATVRVAGTKFGIDLSSSSSDEASVVVKEGTVEVRSLRNAGDVRPVTAGKEAAFSGGAAHDCNVDMRLAAMKLEDAKPAVYIAAANPATAAVKTVELPMTLPIDWETTIPPHSFLGVDIADGIAQLATDLKRSELNNLAEKARQIQRDRLLSIVTHAPMPLRSILNWMSRDIGYRLSDDGAHLYEIAPGALPGELASGDLPPEVSTALDRPIEAPPEASLSIIADLYAIQAGTTVIVDRPEQDKVPPSSTFRETLIALKLNAAWYDHALYVAAASKIEKLTLQERSIVLPAMLLGVPAQPNYEKTLKNLLSSGNVQYPVARVDSALAHLNALENLKLETADGGRVCLLKCKTGLLGAALAGDFLHSLETPSPECSSGIESLSQPAPSSQILGIDALIALVKSQIPVRSELNKFPPLKFYPRNLTRGEALEWGVWLAKWGIRKEAGAVVIDTESACYGPPALKVVSLENLVPHPLLKGKPAEAFALLLPQLYPGLFEGTQVQCLQNTVVFNGTLRQLQIAQRLRHTLDDALTAAPVDMPFDIALWQPEWRRKLEKNLSEPCKGHETKFVNATLSDVLNSGLPSDLRFSLLIDGDAIAAHGKEKFDLDLANHTLRQALDDLAKSVHMRVTLEGNTIWLR